MSTKRKHKGLDLRDYDNNPAEYLLGCIDEGYIDETLLVQAMFEQTTRADLHIIIHKLKLNPKEFDPEFKTPKAKTTVKRANFTTAYKVHAVSTVKSGLARTCNKMTSCSYHPTEQAAIDRCVELLAESKHQQFYIFKAVSIVQSSAPPIEVIHLEE